jgi:hypothetical protein
MAVGEVAVGGLRWRSDRVVVETGGWWQRCLEGLKAGGV